MQQENKQIKNDNIQNITHCHRMQQGNEQGEQE